MRDKQGMQPAFLLDIDCDLYSSSKQALRFMLETGLLVPGSFVYYDDYSVEQWKVPASRHPHKEERLAHEEITQEFQLQWRPLFHHRYQGPVPGLEWIRQWPANNTKVMNRVLSGNNLNPVLQLLSCGRCPKT